MYVCVSCMCILPACVFVHYMCAWCPQRPEEGIRVPKIGVIDNHVLLWGLGTKPRSSGKIISTFNH